MSHKQVMTCTFYQWFHQLLFLSLFMMEKIKIVSLVAVLSITPFQVGSFYLWITDKVNLLQTGGNK